MCRRAPIAMETARNETVSMATGPVMSAEPSATPCGHRGAAEATTGAAAPPPPDEAPRGRPQSSPVANGCGRTRAGYGAAPIEDQERRAWAPVWASHWSFRPGYGSAGGPDLAAVSEAG